MKAKFPDLSVLKMSTRSFPRSHLYCFGWMSSGSNLGGLPAGIAKWNAACFRMLSSQALSVDTYMSAGATSTSGQKTATETGPDHVFTDLVSQYILSKDVWVARVTSYSSDKLTKSSPTIRLSKYLNLLESSHLEGVSGSRSLFRSDEHGFKVNSVVGFVVVVLEVNSLMISVPARFSVLANNMLVMSKPMFKAKNVLRATEPLAIALNVGLLCFCFLKAFVLNGSLNENLSPFSPASRPNYHIKKDEVCPECCLFVPVETKSKVHRAVKWKAKVLLAGDGTLSFLKRRDTLTPSHDNFFFREKEMLLEKYPIGISFTLSN